jgi:Domain of unknown function (DUF4249)
MKNILIFIFASLLFSSCTEEIILDLNSANPQIVIEGAVTDQRVPYEIKISKTINFSDKNEFPAVRGADVTIADNAGVSEKLVEASPGVYKTSKLRGTPGRRYTLTVIVDGKTYTAVSSMPAVVRLESVDITESQIPNLGNNPDQKFYDVFPNYYDPEDATDYYLFNQYSGGKKDKGFFNVKNDLLSNGQYNYEPLFLGLNVKAKDSLKVEMLHIDKGVYNYYYSLSQLGEEGSGTPTNPLTNIKGGALGYFSAHTLQSKTVAVP